MKTLDEVAEHYFSSLNPIAERISADIVAIKDAYEDLWNCLSSKEKNQIINETVVHPEAVLKYTLSNKTCEEINLDIPLLSRQLTGVKYIVDEGTGLSWRDEHSSPFSWKTPSQIDLTLFSSQEVIQPDSKFHAYNNNKNNNNNNNNNKNNNNYNNENKENKCFGLSQTDTAFSNAPNLENFNKKQNKKKGSSTLLPSNVMLVGTCSKFSGLCSKLKFLPGKSYSYEVQTVVSNPTNDGFLDKLKTTAIFKFQNTFRVAGGKDGVNKKPEEYKETEMLVQPEGKAVVRVSKPSPKIAKPKSPPPPPPHAIISFKKNGEKDENKTGKNLLLVKNSNNVNSLDEKDQEKTTLLGENSVQSFLSADPDSLEQDLQSKVIYELSDDFNSISTECTPLSGPSSDVIPKSGFDFLDNW